MTNKIVALHLIGSMSEGDGHRIAESAENPTAKVMKLVKCSRWSELQQTVEYHAQMAAVLKAPTVFRLLNDPGQIVGPQQFSVAERGGEFVHEDISMALRTMTNASPSGCTPLSRHIVEIRENIMAMLPQLQITEQKLPLFWPRTVFPRILMESQIQPLGWSLKAICVR